MTTQFRPLRLAALAIPLLLGACAVSTAIGDSAESGPCSGPILDVSISADGYSIAGESFPAAKLDRKVAAVNKACHITEVRLHPGDGKISVGNALEIGIAAKAIGAAAYFEKDGELKQVKMVD